MENYVDWIQAQYSHFKARHLILLPHNLETMCEKMRTKWEYVGKEEKTPVGQDKISL